MAAGGSSRGPRRGESVQQRGLLPSCPVEIDPGGFERAVGQVTGTLSQERRDLGRVRAGVDDVGEPQALEAESARIACSVRGWRRGTRIGRCPAASASRVELYPAMHKIAAARENHVSHAFEGTHDRRPPVDQLVQSAEGVGAGVGPGAKRPTCRADERAAGAPSSKTAAPSPPPPAVTTSRCGVHYGSARAVPRPSRSSAAGVRDRTPPRGRRSGGHRRPGCRRTCLSTPAQPSPCISSRTIDGSSRTSRRPSTAAAPHRRARSSPARSSPAVP